MLSTLRSNNSERCVCTGSGTVAMRNSVVPRKPVEVFPEVENRGDFGLMSSWIWRNCCTAVQGPSFSVQGPGTAPSGDRPLAVALLVDCRVGLVCGDFTGRVT